MCTPTVRSIRRSSIRRRPAPLDEGELPLLNLVWVGLYRTEEGMGAYTDGLRSFGKDELEVLDARAEPPRCGISS